VTFVTVTRDAESFSRGELELLVAMFADAFREALVRDDAGATPSTTIRPLATTG